MNMKLIISKLLDNIVKELKEENNIEKINKIIEPVINNTIYQLYPYIIVFLICITILFIAIFTILFLNIKICYKK